MHIALMANINGNFPAFAAALSKIEELKEEGYNYNILSASNPKFGSVDGGFSITKQFKEAFGK